MATLTTPPPLTPDAPGYFAAHEKRDDERFASLEAAIAKLTTRQTILLGVLQAIATGVVLGLKG